MKKKKVLILSASIGTGHTQAARAVEEYLKDLPESCEVEHVDFLSNDVLSFDNLVKETYIKILDLFPMLYDLMYYSSQGYKKGMMVKTLVAWGLKRRMLRVIADKKPDLIVFTHPFPAGAAKIQKISGGTVSETSETPLSGAGPLTSIGRKITASAISTTAPTRRCFSETSIGIPLGAGSAAWGMRELYRAGGSG